MSESGSEFTSRSNTRDLEESQRKTSKRAMPFCKVGRVPPYFSDEDHEQQPIVDDRSSSHVNSCVDNANRSRDSKPTNNATSGSRGRRGGARPGAGRPRKTDPEEEPTIRSAPKERINRDEPTQPSQSGYQTRSKLPVPTRNDTPDQSANQPQRQLRPSPDARERRDTGDWAEQLLMSDELWRIMIELEGHMATEVEGFVQRRERPDAEREAVAQREDGSRARLEAVRRFVAAFRLRGPF